MTTTDARTTTRSWIPTAVGVLAVIGAIGSLVMALQHFGIAVPVVDEFSPGPGRVILPPAIAFVVGTGLYGVVAGGAFARRSWAWPLGLVVNALAFASAAVPFRGPVSAVAMVVSAAGGILLALGRAEFRDGR